MVRGTGEGGDGGVALADLYGFGDDEGRSVGGLLDGAGGLEGFVGGLAGAGAAGKFADVTADDFDEGVVDAQADQGGHAVFDGFDEKGAVAEAGSAGAFEDILDDGGDGGGFAVLLADEGDA